MVLGDQYRPPGFTAWCQPEWVVISGGHSSDATGNVAAAYQAIHAHVFHTAHDGAVRFVLDADTITATHWQNGAWRPCN